MGGPPPRGVGVQNLRGGKGAKKGEDPPQICGGLQNCGGEVGGGGPPKWWGGSEKFGVEGSPEISGGDPKIVEEGGGLGL